MGDAERPSARAVAAPIRVIGGQDWFSPPWVRAGWLRAARALGFRFKFLHTARPSSDAQRKYSANPAEARRALSALRRSCAGRFVGV